jgi:hypothetical protein
MCATSLLAAIVAVAFLWHHGPWLVIALVPYAVSYLSYRGAVIVAHEYGAAISTLIDLDRFAFYDYLRMRRPGSTAAERSMNDLLGRLLDHKTQVDLPYEYPDPSDSADEKLKAT